MAFKWKIEKDFGVIFIGLLVTLGVEGPLTSQMSGRNQNLLDIRSGDEIFVISWPAWNPQMIQFDTILKGKVMEIIMQRNDSWGSYGQSPEKIFEFWPSLAHGSSYLEEWCTPFFYKKPFYKNLVIKMPKCKEPLVPFEIIIIEFRNCMWGSFPEEKKKLDNETWNLHTF